MDASALLGQLLPNFKPRNHLSSFCFLTQLLSQPGFTVVSQWRDSRLDRNLRSRSRSITHWKLRNFDLGLNNMWPALRKLTHQVSGTTKLRIHPDTMVETALKNTPAWWTWWEGGSSPLFKKLLPRSWQTRTVGYLANPWVPQKTQKTNSSLR